MSAFTDAAPARNNQPGLRCSVRTAMEHMDPESRADMQAAMEDRSGWTVTRIEAALAGMGYTVGSQTTGRHRRKACSCFR